MYSGWSRSSALSEVGRSPAYVCVELVSREATQAYPTWLASNVQFSRVVQDWLGSK